MGNILCVNVDQKTSSDQSKKVNPILTPLDFINLHKQLKQFFSDQQKKGQKDFSQKDMIDCIDNIVKILNDFKDKNFRKGLISSMNLDRQNSGLRKTFINNQDANQIRASELNSSQIHPAVYDSCQFDQNGHNVNPDSHILVLAGNSIKPKSDANFESKQKSVQHSNRKSESKIFDKKSNSSKAHQFEMVSSNKDKYSSFNSGNLAEKAEISHMKEQLAHKEVLIKQLKLNLNSQESQIYDLQKKVKSSSQNLQNYKKQLQYSQGKINELFLKVTQLKEQRQKLLKQIESLKSQTSTTYSISGIYPQNFKQLQPKSFDGSDRNSIHINSIGNQRVSVKTSDVKQKYSDGQRLQKKNSISQIIKSDYEDQENQSRENFEAEGEANMIRVDSTIIKERAKSFMLTFLPHSQMFNISYQPGKFNLNLISERQKIADLFSQFLKKSPKQLENISTKLIYHYDHKNPKGMNNYILQARKWILICLIQPEFYIGGFVHFNTKKTKVDESFLFSIKGQSAYILEAGQQLESPIQRSGLSFGNNELKLRNASTNLLLNINCINCKYRESNGGSPDEAKFYRGKNTQFSLKDYEIHQVYY